MGICAQNVFINMMLMIKSIIFSIVDVIKEKLDSKELEDAIVARTDNMKIIVESDKSCFKNLIAEHKTFKAVKELEKLWPHHKWLMDNGIDASKIEVEIRFQELNEQI